MYSSNYLQVTNSNEQIILREIKPVAALTRHKVSDSEYMYILEFNGSNIERITFNAPKMSIKKLVKVLNSLSEIAYTNSRECSVTIYKVSDLTKLVDKTVV